MASGPLEDHSFHRKPKGTFHLGEIQKDYFVRSLGEVPGRKLLVLDDRATKHLSQFVLQTELFKQEVFLVLSLSKLSQDREVDARNTVFMIYPSAETVAVIGQELQNPNLQNCYIYCLSPIEEKELEHLAQQDIELNKIAGIKEVASNYTVVNRKTFVLFESKQRNLVTEEFEMRNRLTSVLHSLRVCPTVYYSPGSAKCQSLAQLMLLETEDLLRRSSQETTNRNTLLLILDRKRDWVTPLRTVEHYQAMVNEHFDYQHGIVKLSSLSTKNVMLNELHDEFFSDNLFSGFVQIVQETDKFLKAACDEQRNSQKSIGTFIGMQNVVERLPEIQRRWETATKHSNIMELVGEKMKQKKLFQLMKVETAIVENKLISTAYEEVRNIVTSPEIGVEEKLRISVLYLVRCWEDQTGVKKLFGDLATQGLPSAALDAVKKLAADLRTAKAKETHAKGTFDQLMSGLLEEKSGMLQSVVRNVMSGRMEPEQLLPAKPSLSGGSSHAKQGKPTVLVLFVVGGVSLEEAAQLHHLADADVALVVGGTHLLDTHMFVNQCLGGNFITSAA